MTKAELKKRKVSPVMVSGPIKPGKLAKAKFQSLVRDGKRVKVRVIDANSGDFAAQFLSSFRSSVRRARIENRKLTDLD